MRLINTETGRFEEFFDSNIPLYAILSHTWDQPPKKEQTYQDVMKIQEKYGLSTEPLACSPNSEPTESSSGALTPRPFPGTPPSIWDRRSGLSEKIRKACKAARKDGYRYIWIDSSCIDKTSSSELSEAINSMFNWYRDSQICYAFLSDVPSGEDVRAEDPDFVREDYRLREDDERATRSKFRKSRWFQRSWTLQELIAPRMVVFLSNDWKGLGTKHSLADLIVEITHIDRDILTYEKALADETVAKRMRWAAEREATRVEDRAYSLLGIFGITMPTLYGEGENAFRRLQEEILQRIPDRSLFAWGVCRSFPQPKSGSSIYASRVASPFAPSPAFFVDVGDDISLLSKEDFRHLQVPVEEYTLTPHGIRTKFCFIPIKRLAPSLTITTYDFGPVVYSWHLFVLGSKLGRDGQPYLLGKLCSITHASPSVKLLHVPQYTDTTGDSESRYGKNPESKFRSVIFTIRVSHWTLAGIYTRFLVKPITVYLPHPTPSIGDRQPKTANGGDVPQPTIVLSLSPWTRDALLPGYSISKSDLHLKNPHLRPDNTSSLSLRLYNNSEPINLDLFIQFRHMVMYTSHLGYRVVNLIVIEARVWILRVSPDSESTLDDHPPHTAVIWGTKGQDTTLPARDIHVLTQSGEKKILRLWLGVADYGHYHVYVEVPVAPDISTPTHTPSMRNIAFRDFYGSHGPSISKFCSINPKFTMLGSVRRALEARGYSVHLEGPSGDLDNSTPLSLTLSHVNSGLTITIKYFHSLYTKFNAGQTPEYQELVVVARVTLGQSPNSVPPRGSERYQDGPYVARWTDTCYVYSSRRTWSQMKPRKIFLTSATRGLLELTLDLDIAWESEYYLVVEIVEGGRPYQTFGSSYNSTPSDDHDVKFRLVGPHNRDVTLTLPAHIKRALQAHGYKVYFGKYRSIMHRLTLSNASFTISIDYSYSILLESLTFTADATTPFMQRSEQWSDDISRTNRPGVVSWDASWWILYTRGDELGPDEQEGWHQPLPEKDVKLELGGGLTVTIRLGLYLVWLSEYCITVQVVSQHRSFKGRLTESLHLLTRR